MRTLVVTLLSLLGHFAVGDDCTGKWERFENSPLVEIALPDTHVTYWRYRFEIADSQPFVLRLKAKFPHGRYTNYNVYDQETLDTTGALTDFNIVADAGSTNPFLPGAPRDLAQRAYTAWVIPKGSVRPASGNVLEMPIPIPEGEPKAIELWYRIYAPDKGTEPNGGEALPTIEAFSDVTAKDPIACPQRRAISPALWRALGNLPPKGREDEIRSYSVKVNTMYANFDTRYLISALNFKKGEVALVKFKPPTTPATYLGEKVFARDAQARYWSLCLGGASTRTSACLADHDAVVAKDGWVTVVIAKAEHAQAVKAKGLNFLPSPSFLVPLLIYRNLLAAAEFPGDFAKVPKWDQDAKFDPTALERLDAKNYVGDNAPRGRHCAEDDFFAGRCGLEDK